MASLTFAPGPSKNTVRDTQGRVRPIPPGWECLPPGDAGLTRRVKASGETWAVVEKVGRKTFSRGVWAPATAIATAKAGLEAERQTPTYQKRRVAEVRRRDAAQVSYVTEFEAEVLAFLAFAPRYRALQNALAHAVTAHATPVGSGTVARTKRIGVDERAEAAVIAWLRHQTTAYDSMQIARVKGARRELRRQLAEVSRRLLGRHQVESATHEVDSCALCRWHSVRALESTSNGSSAGVLSFGR